MIINSLTEEITLTHTRTSFFLLKKHPDAFILYHFYCYTASWQQNNLIHATRDFTKTALNWGNDRYHKAKNILIESKIIEDIKDIEPTGRMAGNYILVRTVDPVVKNHLSPNLQVGTETPNNICKENINIDSKPIIKTSEELVEETGDSDLKELLEQKRLRRLKKTPFRTSSPVRFGNPPKNNTPFKKTFTVAHGEGIR